MEAPLARERNMYRVACWQLLKRDASVGIWNLAARRCRFLGGYQDTAARTARPPDARAWQ